MNLTETSGGKIDRINMLATFAIFMIVQAVLRTVQHYFHYHPKDESYDTDS